MNMEIQCFQKAIGKTIRELRKERKLSQEELAYRAGLHRTYIGAIERGERNITVINLYKILRALNINMSYFFKKVETFIDKN